MIILVEGPRGSGKSHLVDRFFEVNRSEDFIYYKFEFSNWLERLKLQSIEGGPEVHYFSISNIITIFDVHSKFFRDKTVIMDRSILSAYVWSIFRDRVNSDKLIREIKSILSHNIFEDSKILYVNKEDSNYQIKRKEKDLFDQYENYSAEKNVYDNLIDLLGLGKSRLLYRFNNQFDSTSEDRFNDLILEISKK